MGQRVTHAANRWQCFFISIIPDRRHLPFADTKRNTGAFSGKSQLLISDNLLSSLYLADTIIIMIIYCTNHRI